MTQDATFGAAVRHDQNGNRLAIGNNGTLNLEAGHNFLTEVGNGAVGTGPTVIERVGTVHRSMLTLTNVAVPTTDHTTNGAQGSLTLYTFPRGNIRIMACTVSLTLTGDGTNITTTAGLVASVGSAAAANDLTLTSTEANIVASTALTLVASTVAFKGRMTADLLIDNTTTTNATALAAILNMVVADAGSTANGSITVTGTIDIAWLNQGDS